MSIRGISLVAAALFSASPALAAEWVADKAHSHIGFSGVQVGAPFHGEFHAYDATISFDPAHPEAAHVRVTIDMGSATSGDKQRDTSLPEPDWFDTAKFPRAVFEATGFRNTGGDGWEAAGTLSIRGISHAVVLPFTLTTAGSVAHAIGRVKLLRTDFGVGQGSWTNGQWVALDVGVDIDITATPAT